MNHQVEVRGVPSDRGSVAITLVASWSHAPRYICSDDQSIAFVLHLSVFAERPGSIIMSVTYETPTLIAAFTSAKNRSTTSALIHDAVKRKRVRVTEVLILLRPGSLLFVNDQGNAVLDVVVGDFLMMRMIIDRSRTSSVVRRFLLQGLCVQNHYGRYLTPVHLAVLQDEQNVVRLLFELDPALLDVVDGYLGVTPIFYAVIEGTSAMVTLLSTLYPAGFHATDSDGNTPFHYAVMGACLRRRVAVLKVLVGAIPEGFRIGNNKGHLPSQAVGPWASDDDVCSVLKSIQMV